MGSKAAKSGRVRSVRGDGRRVDPPQHCDRGHPELGCSWRAVRRGWRALRVTAFVLAALFPAVAWADSEPAAVVRTSTRGGVRVDAAYGKGITVGSSDGDIELNLRARVQVQGAFETNAPQPGGEREPVDTAFLVRRMRLVLQGHALARRVRYYFQLGLSTRDMEPDLLVPVRDAYVEWLDLRDASVRAGQMKVPFSRERVISSSALALVDRSNVNAEMNLDRDVGVQLFSRDLLGTGGLLRYNAGVFGGDGRNRISERAGLLWAARVEALPLGDFDDYVEGDLERTHKLGLSIGIATAYNQSTKRSRSTLSDTYTTGTVDYRHAVADLHAKWRGFSLLAEVHYRKGDKPIVGERSDRSGEAAVERSRSAVAYLVQVGATIASHWDASIRYGEVRPLEGGAVYRDREVGGGVGFYPRGHNLKIQLDYFHLIRDAATSADVETDRVRIQTQLYF